MLDLRDLAVHFQLQGGALSRLFGLKSRRVKAVDGVNVTLHRGEVLGLVGESGSGKTTLGRALLGLVPASEGSITYHGGRGDLEVSAMTAKQLRQLRTDLQMVFQDPSAALNPSMTIEKGVGHPLEIHGVAKGAELRERVSQTLERVGLTPAEAYLSKYPSDLSGGQKQRAVIARAIILEPEVLVADEPVSMLDMSVRAKILQLMLDLKNELGLTYVYITHDLASREVLLRPDRDHVPRPDRRDRAHRGDLRATRGIPTRRPCSRRSPIPTPSGWSPRDLPRGEIPDAAEPPLGCAFHPRCPEATASCGWESRDLRAVVEQHWTRQSSDSYDADAAVLGDLEHLDESATDVHLGDSSPEQVRALVDRMKTENPDEPLWKGVESMEDERDGLRLRFVEGVDPALRRAGGVDVACVLYPEGASAADPA